MLRSFAIDHTNRESAASKNWIKHRFDLFLQKILSFSVSAIFMCKLFFRGGYVQSLRATRSSLARRIL